MRTAKCLVVMAFVSAMIPLSLRAAEKVVADTESAIQATPEPGYLIGPGDLLNIEVWKDPSLTRLVTVLPDGNVTYPMVGEIMAMGKTVSQVKKEVGEKLSLYVKEPVITVEVREVRSLQVYVLGEVRTPGRIIITSNVDVLQALAAAGGPDKFAKRSRIRIIRREGGKVTVIPFDYDDVAAGKNMESNILLRRGDVILVP
jgi:polysaccharide export outer membrane protein